MGVSFSAILGKSGCVEVSNRKKNLFRLCLFNQGPHFAL